MSTKESKQTIKVGDKITINKSDYSQVTGTVVNVSEQKIILDLTKGVKGVEKNVWLTIKDENGKEHLGTLFLSQAIQVGDKVIFDNDKIEIFKSETNSEEKAVKQYQQLVLAGIDQVGVVKELGGNLTTVSYPDGWDLPVPTKYLIVLS